MTAWDTLTLVMLLLVGGVGLAIVHYSRRYLQGEPGLARYLRWLYVTLGAVACLILTKNLLVIALAWLGTSLALQRLLLFFPDRHAAITAAHKKFLVSRAADACLAGSLVLVHRQIGSFELERLEEWTRAHPDLTPSMHVAAVLVACAALLRTAQLPFHGWLIQVMEAPTPVSALLHAGVVNIGGFVLIRLSPWMAQATPARMLLLVVGLFTTIIAALVMTTRVSVKVALAWSTCAQMGFMLVECGLGAWHLALLHLVAHSLYKAHAFLSAGTTVDRWRTVPRGTGVSLYVVVVAATLYGGLHFGASELLPALRFPRPFEPGAWAIAGVGVATLLLLKTLLARPASRLARALYPWLFAGLYLDEWFTRVAFRAWAPPRKRTDAPAPALSQRNVVEA